MLLELVNRRELKVKWINDFIIGREITVNSSVKELEQFIHALILLLIASRLFPKHSNGRLSVKWLYMLHDFTTATLPLFIIVRGVARFYAHHIRGWIM